MVRGERLPGLDDFDFFMKMRVGFADMSQVNGWFWESGAEGNLPEAAEQASTRSLFQKDLSVAHNQPRIDMSNGFFFFGFPDGQIILNPKFSSLAGIVDGAMGADRILRQTDRLPQLHQSLVERGSVIVGQQL